MNDKKEQTLREQFIEKWLPHYKQTTGVRELRENKAFKSDLDSLLKDVAEKAWLDGVSTPEVNQDYPLTGFEYYWKSVTDKEEQ